MAYQLVKHAVKHHHHRRRRFFPDSITIPVRPKTTSSRLVASRARDPTFEKLMDNYKNLLKVVSIQDLVIANPAGTVSLDFLSKLSQRLRLNRGAASFLRKFPHIFRVSHDAGRSRILCSLAGPAADTARRESAAIRQSLPAAAERLTRLLWMSPSKSLPLRAVFKVWRELGLPDDFEDSVISRNPNLFNLFDAEEPGTHLLKLARGRGGGDRGLTAAVERWRVEECCMENCAVDRTEIEFSFRHVYPPGMRLSKDFKAKVREWQRLPYAGPYEDAPPRDRAGSKAVAREAEKRAVAIVHEFLSLTVEKMVEVEKISHFRKWLGIEMNIRGLFLDHPGMFYLSTKGKRHTVFLREAYERGCLVRPNPVYDARRRLLDLVVLGRRGLIGRASEPAELNGSNDIVVEDEE